MTVVGPGWRWRGEHGRRRDDDLPPATRTNDPPPGKLLIALQPLAAMRAMKFEIAHGAPQTELCSHSLLRDFRATDAKFFQFGRQSWLPQKGTSGTKDNYRVMHFIPLERVEGMVAPTDEKFQRITKDS